MKPLAFALTIILISISPVLVSSCSGKHADNPANATLFDRIGGSPAIAGIVQQWLQSAADDPATATLQDGTSEDLQWQLCDKSGGTACGPRVYKPHAGELVLAPADRDRFARFISPGLVLFGVGDREKLELEAVARTVTLYVVTR
jgi:hypothetical protein